MNNLHIAEELLKQARDFAAQGKNLYRVRAYRRAAGTIQALDRSVMDLVAESGAASLRGLPGIGTSLAKTIAALAAEGDVVRAG